MNEFEKLVAGAERAKLTGLTDDGDRAFDVLIKELGEACVRAGEAMDISDVMTGLAMYMGYALLQCYPKGGVRNAEVLHSIVADVVRKGGK